MLTDTVFPATSGVNMWLPLPLLFEQDFRNRRDDGLFHLWTSLCPGDNSTNADLQGLLRQFRPMIQTRTRLNDMMQPNEYAAYAAREACKDVSRQRQKVS